MKTIALLFAALLLQTHASAGQPNILLILADDLGYGDLSIQGCRQFTTPSIDSIAKNGVRFKQGYVSNSVCAPSRAGLLSGRIGIGFESNLPHPTKHGLNPDLPTMADHLKKAGYKTYCIGKWHLGYMPEHHPNRRGFDEFYGLLGGSRTYYAGNLKKLAKDGHAIERNGKLEEEKQGSYVTDRLTHGAVDYISTHAKKHPKQPFFMYLSYTAPHGPLEPKPGYAERYPNLGNEKRRAYAGLVASLDEGVGQVLQCLENNKLLENTIIVFMSDNGGPENQNASSNGALRGEKGTLWEGGVRVPFFIQWLEKIPSGKELDEPVISLDLLPTFGKAAGIKYEIESDGINLWPLILNHKADAPVRSFYWRRGGMKNCAFRQGKYKWLENRRTGQQWLFDIEADLAEKTNVMDQYPEVAEKMKRKYAAWEKSVPDPAFESGWKPKRGK
ncbi:sulfatase-like hydrolase/transferase [Pontiellaceae bacterium B12227]|nr:sulfatase-like hydrolase/transferase [Pontiellaceae bacterium B12227]